MPPKKVQPRRSGPIAGVDPKVALIEFTSLFERAGQLRQSSPEFNAWHSDVMIALSRYYGSDSEEYSRFEAIRFGLSFFSSATPQSDFEAAFHDGLAQARLFLESRQKDWEGQISPSKPARRSVMANPKDVFVVHGHDHGMKETVARFLAKLGLNPIILHEKADEGRTIIEKFEKLADVSFAVAIFSRDDLGVAVNDIPKTDPIEKVLRPRARQNVVLEFGFFMGALGRENVRAIVEDGVETPSDYSGVLYITFDAADGWRLKLVRELKAAGLDVDANAAF
jgi:predicted nucleotide-binding protein